MNDLVSHSSSLTEFVHEFNRRRNGFDGRVGQDTMTQIENVPGPAPCSSHNVLDPPFDFMERRKQRARIDRSGRFDVRHEQVGSGSVSLGWVRSG